MQLTDRDDRDTGAINDALISKAEVLECWLALSKTAIPPRVTTVAGLLGLRSDYRPAYPRRRTNRHSAAERARGGGGRAAGL